MNRKIQVFKDEPGFLKLFSLFKEKYRSLGRIGGNVPLTSFRPSEIESIAGFLGVPMQTLVKKGKIPLLEFEKELANTGYSEYTLLTLMQEVLGETIQTKKEELEQELKEENVFLSALNDAIPEASHWLEWIRSKSPETRWIWSLYKEDKEDLYGKMVTVSRAFASLPKDGSYERLPFFSQRTTGNPHYFDPNGAGGKLLVHRMYVHQVMEGNHDLTMPKTVEDLNDLYAGYGIMRDDLWNFVTCQGLLASTKGEIHPVWEAATSSNTVMNVPMKELAKLDSIWPAAGRNVWILENSGVCSTIMDAAKGAPIVCTHGQLRAAAWTLLDKLAQSNCMFYYSGDIDPEGIIIAEKLKKRYPNQLVTWRMDLKAYESSLSNEDISDRLLKLDKVVSSEWTDVIHIMKEKKKAGYQEAIVMDLIEDIRINF